MAAAGRAPGRWSSRRRWRRSRRLPFVEKQRTASMSLVEEETAGEHHGKSFGRMVAFHGQMGMFTRALDLHHEPRRRRPAGRSPRMRCSTPIMCCAASRTCSTRRSAASGPCMHEALFSDKGFARRPHHARSRQGADRRGLSPDDHVFPAGRPRRDAGRADRDREQGRARPVHRRAAAASPSGPRRATRASRPRRSTRRGAGSTRRWRRASRCWSTRSPAQAAE